MDSNITEKVLNEITNAREGHGRKTEEKEDELVACPCCGKLTLRRPIQPKGDLMDHFMSCMVTGVPYARTYDLYDNKLHIKVTQVTGDVSNMVDLAATQLQDYRPRIAGNDAKLSAIADAIRTYACVESITVDAAGGKTFMPSSAVKHCCDELSGIRFKISSGDLKDEELQAVIDKCDSILKDTTTMSAIPVSMLMSVVQLHNHIYSIMMDAGFDENFWDRIKLA